MAFSSASAAVSCAVLTQQLFERRYLDAEQALHVRIGLGTGEATIKDGDYSPATKMLAGRVQGARFESAGEMDLKGIPEPMEAFALAWEPLGDESGVQVGAWPVPPALRSVPRAPYACCLIDRRPEGPRSSRAPRRSTSSTSTTTRIA